MPGFNIGSGPTQISKYNKSEFRRKHRWRMRAEGSPGDLGRTDWIYLQKSARPSFKYLEAIVHHDQEQAYFAGKQEWEAITVTWYDAESVSGKAGGGDDISSKIYNWIAVNNKNVGVHEDANVTLPSNYKIDIILEMTGADGNPTETWTLHGAWPMSVNWQDLDYTNTEVALVEVQIRYDRATRKSGGATATGG